MRFLFALILLMFAPLVAQSAPRPLVVDLSSDEVEINVGFSGANLLMFGAVELPNPDAPFDLFVNVVGPANELRVRRKERVLGLWINRDSKLYRGVPGFYKSFSARKLDKVMSPALQKAAQNTGFGLLQGQTHGAEYDAALIRQMAARGLFEQSDNAISFLSNQLFRADVRLPSNVPTGTYYVRAQLIQDGRNVFTTTTSLEVHKVGVGASVYQFAQNHGLLYGIVAVFIAVLMGYLSYAVFKRR